MVVKDDLKVLSTKRYSLNGKIKKFMYTAHVQRKKEKLNTT